MPVRVKLPPARSLVPLVPALLALLLVLSFGSEVPYGDEWDTPGELLEAISEGNATWQHYLAQHNESRKAVPRLVFSLGALLLGWRVMPYMVLGWLYVLITLWLLLELLPGDRREDSAWALAAGSLVAALLFSPIQVENQLWGIQMIVFMPPLCLVASLWAQARLADYRNVVLWCALLSLVAMFSFANGMLCWLLAFPLVGFRLAEGGAASSTNRGEVRVWTAVYLALAVASGVVYFWGYHRPPHHPSLIAGLEDPGLAIRFLATWLGTPFAPAFSGFPVDSAVLVGTLVVLLLGLVAVRIVRESRARPARRFWRPYYPWICVTAYGALSGLVTTAGRAGLGEKQATSGRYCTIALWVVVGVVGMAAVLWRSQSGRRLNSTRLVCLLVGGTVGFLTALSWYAGLDKTEEAGHRTRQHLLTLRLLEAAPGNPLIGCPEVECLYAEPEKVRRRAAVLSEAGMLTVDFIGPWLAAEVGSPAGVAPGEIRIANEGPNRVRVVGWAALPDGDRPPDFVALARPGLEVGIELISGLIMKDHLHRGIAPQVDTERNLAFFGEALPIPVSAAGDLRAFAVDVDRERAWELSAPPR